MEYESPVFDSAVLYRGLSYGVYLFQGDFNIFRGMPRDVPRKDPAYLELQVYPAGSLAGLHRSIVDYRSSAFDW